MIEEEIVYWIICYILTIIICLIIGYTWATRASLMAIENVERWIKDTKSSQWVAYSIHKELEEKYIALLKEYEQYRGMIKAINDYENKDD